MPALINILKSAKSSDVLRAAAKLCALLTKSSQEVCATADAAGAVAVLLTLLKVKDDYLALPVAATLGHLARRSQEDRYEQL